VEAIIADPRVRPETEIAGPIALHSPLERILVPVLAGIALG
jgi:hypothetical protein